MSIYKLSYDHDLDCILSLANYYHVDTKTINLKAKEVNDLIKSESNLDIPTKLNLINLIVTGKQQRTNERIRVSFYHRCISDGTKEWFSDGLLNSEDGLKSFLKKYANYFQIWFMMTWPLHYNMLLNIELTWKRESKVKLVSLLLQD